MPLSKDDVKKVAHLARINLSGEELKTFSKQLDSIIDYIDNLKEVDISSVQPKIHAIDMLNVLRQDKKEGSLTQEEALRNAPESVRGHFKVPKVIE